VDGGYCVTGTWSFGSGIHSASYVLGGCTVFEDGEPVLKEDGSQLVIGAWFRTEDVTILDDWHVVGLRASGSSGYRVTGRFVPGAHTFDRYFAPDPFAEPLNKLVDLPFYSMAGIAIGLSQHAVDLATDSLRGRPRVGERQLALLGEADSLLRAARAVVYEGVRRIDDAIFTDGTLPDAYAMARGDAPVATDLARRIVDLCAEIVGSRLVFESFPMEGIVRDLVGLTAHASTWRSRWVDVGRTILDEPDARAPGADTEEMQS
jgi:alkylation response protein AidB-like acyl-CoA dehydrogenase